MPSQEEIFTSQSKLAQDTEKKGTQKSWWQERSWLEKNLVKLLVVCVVIVIAFIIALAVVAADKNDNTVHSEGDTGASTTKVCTTRDCVIAAARMAESMDFSKQPCEDFYSFACGKWREDNVIPEDKSSISTFGILRDKVDVVLKNLLENNATAEGHDVLLKTHRLYASCMNLAELEERGSQPLIALLNTLGGWPILNASWDSSKFSLTDGLVQLALYNKSPMVSGYVGTDTKNSSARILYIDQPGFGLPGRKYYLDDGRNSSNILAYQMLMKNIALALGANLSTVNADVIDIVDFEIQLANISVPDEDRRDSDKLYNVYSLPELGRNFTGAVNWTLYFTSLLQHRDVQVSLEADEIIINRSPAYFTRLLNLLAVTQNRTVANYLIWRLAMDSSAYLSEEFRGFFADYNKVVYGTPTPAPRFKTCVSVTTDILGLAVGNLFVKTAFDEEAKKNTLEMIAELKRAFNQLLDVLTWMDDATKAVAREKNEFIDEKIGYPDEVLNTTYLTTLYENYTFRADQYFENRINTHITSVRASLRRLREAVDKNQWTTAPSTVNAFYSSNRNQIMFPAGILQPIFYSKTYPKSLNFGGIGVVIGHEITHGFDDRGRQYDKDGNLKQWWSDEIIQKFKERAQCIVNQYGNFTVPEAYPMKLNGINTQGENIADNGGLKQSFRAYRNWVDRQGEEEPLLPGFETYNNNQLFFINFAQIWCTNMRREDAIQRILTGVHSPGQFRVIGTLQNSEDFAKAFNCKSGNYMNPSSKCVVW